MIGRRLVLSLSTGALAASVFACGSSEDAGKRDAPTAVTPAPVGEPWDTLEEWNLFADAATQTPAERVLPYDVISPLFSDYTTKHRFMHVPEGATVAYDDDAKWGFPVGTILVKTFAYAHDLRDVGAGTRLLETRLLVRETESAWAAHTYVYDEAGQAAERVVAGKLIDATWVHTDGSERSTSYGVPNTNECQDCHGKNETMNTLGGRTRQLDRDGQLEALADAGLLDREPAPANERVRLVDPLGSAELEPRVRSYLDANCGHCHAPDSHASSSAVYLDWESTDFAKAPPAEYGVCKYPTSAGGATCGLTFDVVPGKPESSILVCRIASTEAKVRMPPLASKIAHDEGVALLEEWVRGLPGASCQ